MLAEERKKIICELVNRKKAVRVTDLSKRLDITEATIRRDLDELQKENKLRRTHGGAVSLYTAGQAGSISNLSMEHVAEKHRIAELAYGYICDFDTVLFDGSSTVMELARILGNGSRKGVTVLTNSISVAGALTEKAQRNEIKVILIGGEIKYHLSISVGDIAIRTIRNVRVDKTFMGINGIDSEYGYSIADMGESTVKKEMIRSAKQVFVLADRSKFGESYLAKIAEPEGDIDYLITDSRTEDFDYSSMEEMVHMVYADEELNSREKGKEK